MTVMGSEADRQLPDRRGRKADTEPAPDALSAILGLWAKSRQAAHDPITVMRRSAARAASAPG